MKKGELFFITGNDDFYAYVEFRKWVSATVVEVVSCTYGWIFCIDFENHTIKNMYTDSTYTFNGTESWVDMCLNRGAFATQQYA